MSAHMVVSQTNFSGGQCDESARNQQESEKVVAAGARTMSNWRPLNSGGISVRPGRAALSLTDAPRAERFRFTPAVELIIAFSSGAVKILNALGTILASNTSASYLWTDATVSQISWTATPDRVVICYPGMRPQLILWDRDTGTYSFALFDFAVLFNNQKQEPFFRTASRGTTMTLGARSGTFLAGSSAPYFTAAMVGQRISLAGQQAAIAGYISSTAVNVTVPAGNKIPRQIDLTLGTGGTGGPATVDAAAIFPLSTVAETSVTKVSMEITDLISDSVIRAITLNDMSGAGTNPGAEHLVGSFGKAQLVSIADASAVAYFPFVSWQQSFMNDIQGWPSACFFAHGRLGFCDFPQRPEAILWSAIGIYDVFWVDSIAALANPAAGVLATSAMLEFIPGKPRVRNVVEWNGDEFIFTDKGVYYIPVSAQNPLKPGSVEFRVFSDASASSIKPAFSSEALIFVSASGDRVSSVRRTGSLTTPYLERDLAPYHSALIKNPVAIAVGLGDSGAAERYIYVLNADGTLAIGRITDDYAGWFPWFGAGAVSWVSVAGINVLLTTLYGTQKVLEYETFDRQLDHAVSINSPPALMLSGGHGPLIAFAGGTVRVMDGWIDYGDRSVDASGNLIANPEDDFSSAGIVAGVAYTSEYSPFLPEGPRGAAGKQRQRRRKIVRAVASVVDSSGFSFGGRTIPPYDFDDDPLAQPILKSTSYRTSPMGRDFDPRITLVKDTPGPLTLIEFVQEVTV